MRTLVVELFFAIMLLAACAEDARPSLPPPTPTPLAAIPLDDLLAHGVPAKGQTITTVGYLLVEPAGVRLVGALSFSAGATPQALAPASAQIWLGAGAARSIEGVLRVGGTLRYALVVARGQIEGPGAYGPDGIYAYQLSGAALEALAPQETTIAALLEHPASYEGRPVRLAGAILARSNQALLVERLGAGGIPAPGARQVKLRAPLRDTSLLERLRGAPGGAVRFGMVQVEGFWRNGQLEPLAILLIT